MKQWFPFTDYDFYGYLTAGICLIAAVDYTVGVADLLHPEHWTAAQSVLWR